MLNRVKNFISRNKMEYQIFEKEVHRKPKGEKQDYLSMLLLAHSIEKGEGLPTVRNGYGKEKAEKLLGYLLEYKEDEKSFELMQAYSVLERYVHFCRENGVKIENIEKEFGLLSVYYVDNKVQTGVRVLERSALYNGFSLEEASNFLTSRHSIRDFEKKTVDDETMQQIVRLALSAPSACNRQPVKVYYTYDADKVSRISCNIEGIRGFEDHIPNWALVTASRDLFRTSEYFQWYMNGGIFLGYLLQAFHAHQIGSCTFQTPISFPGTTKIRLLMNIPEDEVIIAAVGYGYVHEQVKVLYSARRDVEQVLVKR